MNMRLKLVSFLTITFVVLTSLLGVQPVGVQEVSAASVSGLAFPFDQGTEWEVASGGGYHNGGLHEAYARYALDLYLASGEDTGGLNVRLPADAKYYRIQHLATYKQNPANTPKCIDFAIDEWSSTEDLYLEICHVDFVTNLAEIYALYNKLPKGMVLGTVAEAGTCSNDSCDTAHIHIAAHIGPKLNPWSGGTRTAMEFKSYSGYSLELDGHSFPQNGNSNQWAYTEDLYSNFPNGEPNYLTANTCNNQQYNVVLWMHINFSGDCIGLNDLSQTYNVPSSMHISSIYMSPDWTDDHFLMVYSGYDLGGSRWGILLDTVTDLSQFNNWNDLIKSMHNTYTGPGWFDTFAISDNPPLETIVHVVVNDEGDFDAMRVCFNGENCQETAATELYYTWPTHLEEPGQYTLKLQYRRDTDNQNWANADELEFAYYLNMNRLNYAPCGSNEDGANLTSGSNCVKVTSDVADLAVVNWADRNSLSITADGVDVLAYDSSDFVGAPYYIRDGQTVSVGNNVSGIELREPLGSSAYVPIQPLGTDANTTAYLPMDEGSGTLVNDSVGSLDGTLAGSASFTTGRFGQAIAGSSSPIGGVNFGAVNLGSPLTVEMFVKFNSLSGDPRIAAQLGGNGNSGYNKWQLQVTGGRFRLWSCYISGCHEGYSLENVQTNKWYYLMFTYDGSTTAKLYVDSLYQTTLSMDGTMSSGSTTLEIGKGENNNGCNCVIDDVRISNIVREPVMPGVWNGGLVSNGSFEALTSGWANNWTRNNTNSVLIDTGSNGTHGANSLRFTSDTANHHAFSGEISVSSANSYTWLSRVRSTSGSGEFGFYIDEYNTSHNWISGQWFSALPASLEGTKIIRYTPSSSSVAYASLQYYMNANTSYEVYVDSVSFTQNTSSNLVTNGGFEYLLGGWADAWTRNNTSYITVSTSSQGNEGTNSLHFSPPSGNVHAFGPRFPVGSGTYTWSQYVVTTSGTGEFGFYIDEYDANGDWISGQWKGGVWGASSGVQSFTYTRSSSNVAYAVPQLYVLSGTTFDVYVDSVSFGQ